MGMGIVSEKDFTKEFLPDIPLTPIKKESEFSEPVSKPEGIIVDVNPRGRGENSTEVPNSLRNLIGDESQTNGRQSAIELAQSFGISASSVSAYNAGATSTSTYNDRPNIGAIRKARERIAKRARGKLFLALSKITEDKLDEANVKDLSMIAKDMSTIIRNVEPVETESNKDKNVNNGPTFVFYAPQIRKENTFEEVVGRD